MRLGIVGLRASAINGRSWSDRLFLCHFSGKSLGFLFSGCSILQFPHKLENRLFALLRRIRVVDARPSTEIFPESRIDQRIQSRIGESSIDFSFVSPGWVHVRLHQRRIGAKKLFTPLALNSLVLSKITPTRNAFL